MTDSIAIAHKDYLVRGGGERLVERLARAFDCPLFVGGLPNDVRLEYDDTQYIRATRGQRLLYKRGGVLRSLANIAMWQNDDRLAKYDTLITSGNEPLWYVPPPEQCVVSYCHSPPRLMYDLNHNTGVGTVGALIRAGKRAWFQHNIPRVDLWIANSETVQRRIQRYWGVERETIHVVYPPVDVASYSADTTETQDYYLCLGRLAGHKRVDEAIQCINASNDRRLKVAGRGPERETLETLAGPNVETLGYVSEQEKRELLSGARALIMPAQSEDFGMVTVESFASGTPVLGVDEGFTSELVNDGKNGLTYERGTLSNALHEFENGGIEWDAQTIERYADQFCVARFNEEMEIAREIAEERVDRDTGLDGPRNTVT